METTQNLNKATLTGNKPDVQQENDNKKKKNLVCSCNGILCNHAKITLLIHTITWMNLTDSMLNKRSQTQQRVMCDSIYMEFKNRHN